MFRIILVLLRAFAAGLLSMLVFHQGALAGLHQLGATGIEAWRMTPGWPLGMPVLLTHLLWGGVWGVALWSLLRNAEAAGYYVGAILLGAALPSAAALFVALPMAGRTAAVGWDMHFIAGMLVLNAIWGLGTALLLRLFMRPAA